ncbi:tyrosine-type recombinase/integrase [Bradyrhizobium sp. 482_C4_N1_1]|uniref:tyrosine-type recombinase/integrase n=1 Tax=unclassified Bradyrhizobium TaxID=2631580 RepID=UPI003F8C35D2
MGRAAGKGSKRLRGRPGGRLPRFTRGYIDDCGHPRHYTRIPGVKPVALPGLPWSTEFIDALDKALASRKAPEKVEIGASRTVPGTVNAAIVLYYTSAQWQSLAPGTRPGRKSSLERFRNEHGEKRLRMLAQPHLQAYINTLQPGPQRNMLQAVKHFLDYCVTVHLIPTNPATGVTRVKRKGGSFFAWGEEHYAKFCGRHPVGTMARLALALYVNLGVRKSDVVRIGPRDVHDGVLTDFTPQKTSRSTGMKINVPLMQETRDIIAATPLTGTETYLVTSFGKPFTANGFGNKMREWCDEAGLPECSSHGLRKLCLTRLADYEGPDGRVLDVRDLQAISGHKDLRELQVYIENADRKRRAKRAIAQLEEAQKRGRDEVAGAEQTVAKTEK